MFNEKFKNKVNVLLQFRGASSESITVDMRENFNGNRILAFITKTASKFKKNKKS